MSAAMANQFVEATTEMTEQISALGPNPLRVPSAVSMNTDTDTEEPGEKL